MDVDFLNLQICFFFFFSNFYVFLIMMIYDNFLNMMNELGFDFNYDECLQWPLKGGGFWGGRCGRSKKERWKRNSDARHGYSQRSFTVRNVGWTEVRGIAALLKKSRGAGDYSYPFTILKERTAKRWMALGRAILPVGGRSMLVLTKKSEGHGLELHVNWKSVILFRTTYGGNIVLAR